MSDVTRYTIFDPANGDELGVLEADEDAPEELIVESLVEAGYLDPPADSYTLDDGYMLATDGERVIVDVEGDPVLTLEAENIEDSDPDDDDDELDGEDVL